MATMTALRMDGTYAQDFAMSLNIMKHTHQRKKQTKGAPDDRDKNRRKKTLRLFRNDGQGIIRPPA